MSFIPSLRARVRRLEARDAPGDDETLLVLIEHSIELELRVKAMTPEEREAYEIAAAAEMRAWLAGPEPEGKLSRLIWQAARAGQELAARELEG